MESHKLSAILWAAGIGASLAVLERFVPAKVRKWMPSVSGVGIAMTVGFTSSFSMFIGACLAWLLEKLKPQLAERFTVVVSSGLIAGETLMAVALIAWGVITGSM
jgi:uncharacterized oligopeptide transporter (OPT) family protein